MEDCDDSGSAVKCSSVSSNGSTSGGGENGKLPGANPDFKLP